MKNNSLQRGTTLLETLIYITLLSFIMAGTLISVYQILGSSNSNTSKNVTEQEAGFIMAKINWALSGASAINSPGPNSSSSSLSVTKDGNTILFASSGNDITIKNGAGSVTVLNSSRSKISTLNFQHIQQTGVTTTDSLKISFYLDGNYYEVFRNIR